MRFVQKLAIDGKSISPSTSDTITSWRVTTAAGPAQQPPARAAAPAVRQPGSKGGPVSELAAEATLACTTAAQHHGT